ncbi:MAG: YvcK family protein [Candidatus Peribacteria bacterium]|nr:MAG: YvcK family protein [Candidatus Peribacteria bacterium]
MPVTLELSHLCVDLEDGTTVKGENDIDVPKHDPNLRITRAYLEPEVQTNPKAIRAIEKSDVVIITFGDLYTSIIPNLLTKGLKKAIKNSKAKVIYMCNLMTKKGETTNFGVVDFIDTLEEYLGKDVIDYVVVNSGYISDKLAEKYKSVEGKSPVKVKDRDYPILQRKPYRVIERDLLHESSFVRHSYDKVGKVIKEILQMEGM